MQKILKMRKTGSHSTQNSSHATRKRHSKENKNKFVLNFTTIEVTLPTKTF
ncbi:hypothetical protein [uncultured Prevotella sp.]|uniref:hypothetical protein n=1 Tax=uncultured Prevotella sp. TaxID=159272 RepID=UPI002674A03D|nr:hypothetical protein [uncultured Prevotella sp.]